MATTSIKLPDALKDRVRSIAEARSTSVHAFLVSSVQDAVDAAEQQISFLADAKAAEAQMRDSGQGYDAADVHRHLKARARGDQSQRPQSESWRG